MTPAAALGVVLTALALAATGCEFDGAYDLPLPGLAGRRRTTPTR